MAWPIAGYPGDSGRTNAQMQTYMDEHLALTKKLTGGPKGTNLVITGAGGVSGITSNVHGLINDGGAGADIVTSISTAGVEQGHVLTLYQVVSTSTTTITHGTSLQLEGDANFDLVGSASGTRSILTLILFNTVWVEVSRCWGNDTAGYAAHIGAVGSDTTNLTGQTTAELLNITSNNLDALQVGTAGGAHTEIGSGFIRTAAATGTDLSLRGGANADVRAWDDGAAAYGRVITTQDDAGVGGTFDADTTDNRHASELMQSPKYARLSVEIAGATGNWAVIGNWNNSLNWTDEYDPHGLISFAGPTITVASAGVYRVKAWGAAYDAWGAGTAIGLQMAVWATGGGGAYDIGGHGVWGEGTIVELVAHAAGEVSVAAGEDLVLRGFPSQTGGSGNVSHGVNYFALTGVKSPVFNFEIWWLNEA